MRRTPDQLRLRDDVRDLFSAPCPRCSRQAPVYLPTGPNAVNETKRVTRCEHCKAMLTELTNEHAEKAEMNIGLIAAQVPPWIRPEFYASKTFADEVRDAGWFWLTKAVATFNAALGWQESTYFSAVVRNGLKKEYPRPKDGTPQVQSGYDDESVEVIVGRVSVKRWREERDDEQPVEPVQGRDRRLVRRRIRIVRKRDEHGLTAAVCLPHGERLDG